MFSRRRSILILNLILLFILLFLFSRKTNFKSKIVNYCSKNKLKLKERFYSHLIYIPELKILFCDVQKAASSNLRRFIYVYFNQTNSYEKLDRKTIWIDYNKFFRKFYLTENSEFIYKNENIFKFLLVRHPFRRIYSTYYDKFMNDNLDDLFMGWKQVEEDILIEMKLNETLLTIRGNDLRLDFRTFLLFIIRTIKENRLINSHWEQIAQRCGFCVINYDWFGKIENFNEDQKILLKKFHRENFEFPSKTFDQRKAKEPSLTDSQLVQFFRDTIQNDQDFQVLINYYKPDFQIFDYDLPYL